MSTDFISELHAAIADLDSEQQRTVLSFVDRLKKKPAGFTAEAFREFSGTMSSEEAEDMLRVIDEGCGKVDADGW